MERKAIVGVLILGGIVVWATHGRILYVVADANCVQVSIDPNTVDFPVNAELALQVRGALLPPAHARAGKFNWRGRYCDPEGDPVTITLATAPAGMSLSFEPGQIAVVAGELTAGVHVIVFHLVDAPTNAPPAAADVTLLVKVDARPNTPPVLY